MTPAERTLRAKIAAHTRWANEVDYAAATKPARDALDKRFANDAIASAAAQGVTLTNDELQRRIEHGRKAHYLRMAANSAKARRGNKAV